jgi:hypothetical protein
MKWNDLDDDHRLLRIRPILGPPCVSCEAKPTRVVTSETCVEQNKTHPDRVDRSTTRWSSTLTREVRGMLDRIDMKRVVWNMIFRNWRNRFSWARHELETDDKLRSVSFPFDMDLTRLQVKNPQIRQLQTCVGCKKILTHDDDWDWCNRENCPYQNLIWCKSECLSPLSGFCPLHSKVYRTAWINRNLVADKHNWFKTYYNEIGLPNLMLPSGYLATV